MDELIERRKLIAAGAALALLGASTNRAANVDAQDSVSVRTEMPFMNDHNEILRIVFEYCRLLDGQRGRGLAQLFTEDAKLTRQGSDTVHGNKAIEATFGRGPPRLQPRIHVASNPIIIINGDRASGSIDHLLLERNEDGTFAIVFMGRWIDSYVRGAPRWLIAERVIEFPYGEPSARVQPPSKAS